MIKYLYISINDNNISILNINARSLVKQYNELTAILQVFSVSFDVITTVETWLNDTLLPLLQIDGYNLFLLNITKIEKKRWRNWNLYQERY